MKRQVDSKEVRTAVYKKLKERGVNLEDIAKIVYEMQIEYNESLTMDLCIESIEKVLEKREIQHAILVGIEIDILAEQNLLSEPIQSIIESDEGLFGIDETMAIGSVYGYGSIALTTFGYLDKNKMGIIEKLDNVHGKKVNTFLDDSVAAIAACACGRIAHHLRDVEEGLVDDSVTSKIEENVG